MDYTKLPLNEVFCFKLVNGDTIVGKIMNTSIPSIIFISQPLEVIFEDGENNGNGIPTTFYLTSYMYPVIPMNIPIPINMMNVITFNKVSNLLKNAYFDALEKIENEYGNDDDGNNENNNPNKRYLH